MIWEGEPGDRRTLTYAALDAEVVALARALFLAMRVRVHGEEGKLQRPTPAIRPMADLPRPADSAPLARIVLGVTGGIAAFKAAELARLFVKAGVAVDVVMTEAATRFVTPMTFQALTGRPVATRSASSYIVLTTALISGLLISSVQLS